MLGQRTDKVTETLARRCRLILGSTNRERKAIRRSFKKLYALRSNLVHGKVELGEAHGGHLAVARYIARDISVWFLRYLCFVAESLPEDNELQPKRTDLLSALEMSELDRSRIAWLFGRLPCGFPSNQSWEGDPNS